MKPTAQKADVRRVSNELISKNTFSTSKDVKDQLRAENFWAEQKPISALLQEIAREDGYTVITDTTPDGKTYNKYFSATTGTGNSVTGNSAPTVNANPQTVGNVLDAIENIFGTRINENEKFENTDVSSESDLENLLADIAPQFGIDTTKFIGSDFEPKAIIIWREKTPAELAAFIDTLTGNSTQPSPQSAASVTVAKSRKPRTKVTAKPIFVVPSTSTPAAIATGYNGNDWVVHARPINGTDRAIYSGSESRDHVRSAYATQNGVPIQSVRSRRVAHIDITKADL